jgi:hypothetical protein
MIRKFLRTCQETLHFVKGTGFSPYARTSK